MNLCPDPADWVLFVFDWLPLEMHYWLKYGYALLGYVWEAMFQTGPLAAVRSTRPDARHKTKATKRSGVGAGERAEVPAYQPVFA